MIDCTLLLAQTTGSKAATDQEGRAKAHQDHVSCAI